jgi:hypothetical protein
MKRTAIVLAIALSAGGLSAALAAEKVDHLEPYWSALGTELSDHRKLVIRTVFHDAWDRDILLRMHSDDGALGAEEYVIALKSQNGKYSVVNFHTSHRLGSYWFAPPLPLQMGPKKIPPMEPTPKDYRDIKPTRCEIAVTPGLAKRIVATWQSALMETRYYEEEPRPPVDGGWYEFSMENNDQTLAGTIPDGAEDGSKPARLMSIALDMRILCMDRTAKARTALETDLAAFEKQYGSR